ncbi:MAG: RrF2 family transcriptional regulator [Oscillospiraceae bacterium]|nr:RrF2 family transcriptional regulator [Oscillospiraceae bacterium]
MKISTKGRYALRMMLDISENSNNEWIPIKEISERQGISIKYLEQIVTSLTRAGLLRSGRGPQGGYMLTKLPEQYTAGEIIRAIEGKLAPVACLADEVNLCERKDCCKTLGFWQGLYETIDSYVDSVTLKDFAGKK